MKLSKLLLDHGMEKVDYELTGTRPVMMFHQQCDDYTKPAFDIHYAVSFGIVLSGQVRMIYGDWDNVYGPGQIWFTGIWEPHGWNIIQAPYDVLYMFVLPEWIDIIRYEEAPELKFLDLFMSPPHLRPKIAEPETSFFIEWAEKYKQILTYPLPYRRVLPQIIFQEIMSEIFVRYAPMHAPSGASFKSFGKINPALNLLFSRRTYITEKEAANACNMSLKAFNNAFVKLMGTTFAKFSLQHRLNGVVTNLLQTNKPIKRIAFEWGFKHLSNLNHCFKKEFGCSPTQYCEKFDR